MSVAELQIFSADLVCECGSYWSINFHEINEDHECLNCGRILRIYVDIEILKNEEK